MCEQCFFRRLASSISIPSISAPLISITTFWCSRHVLLWNMFFDILTSISAAKYNSTSDSIISFAMLLPSIFFLSSACDNNPPAIAPVK